MTPSLASNTHRSFGDGGEAIDRSIASKPGLVAYVVLHRHLYSARRTQLLLVSSDKQSIFANLCSSLLSSFPVPVQSI